MRVRGGAGAAREHVEKCPAVLLCAVKAERGAGGRDGARGVVRARAAAEDGGEVWVR